MSGYVTKPVIAIFGATMGIVIVILAVTLLAGSGAVGGSSNALGSTGTGLTNILPFIALILAGGISIAALSGRRH
jgi:hypothetical protein